VVAIGGAVFVVVVSVLGVVHALDEHRNAMMRQDLEAAFSDIADLRWKCDRGELPSETDGYRYSCDLRSSGLSGPSVSFEAFAAPQGPATTAAQVSERQRDLTRRDASGADKELTLLGTDEWAPQGGPDTGGEPWGSVARWRIDYEGFVYPVYAASYRYADKPFGLTVYARSEDKVEEVVASLDLPEPGELPD
jgi:hypothetical protein